MFPYSAGPNMTIKAIAFDGNGIFAGGRFDSSQTGPAGNLARWNGSAWTGLGEGYPGLVNDLVVQGHDVLLAGKPDSQVSGGAAALRGQAVGRWNGSIWESLGGGLGGEAYKVAVFKGDGDPWRLSLCERTDFRIRGETGLLFGAVETSGSGWVVAYRRKERQSR
jgi:hypothetical protein